MVLGTITATNTTPATKGKMRPVTEEVLSMVTTRAMIRPMRNTSLSCENTSSITVGCPIG